MIEILTLIMDLSTLGFIIGSLMAIMLLSMLLPLVDRGGKRMVSIEVFDKVSTMKEGAV